MKLVVHFETQNSQPVSVTRVGHGAITGGYMTTVSPGGTYSIRPISKGEVVKIASPFLVEHGMMRESGYVEEGAIPVTTDEYVLEKECVL